MSKRQYEAFDLFLAATFAAGLAAFVACPFGATIQNSKTECEERFASEHDACDHVTDKTRCHDDAVRNFDTCRNMRGR